MKSNSTKFIVLIERRALKQAFTLFMLLALALALVLSTGQRASAAPGKVKEKKVARDLQAALDSPTAPTAKWARDINGQRHVQVVIMSSSIDGEMTNLRTSIKAVGGSVHVAMPGLRAVTATLPAAQVASFAARSDVVSVVPNRTTSRTASLLEKMTGALTPGVRTNSTKTDYSGLDGSRIGIAVLDSGVMTAHEAFNNDNGKTRVMRNVQMLGTTQANWSSGTDASSSLQPGSAALNAYESAIANDSNLIQDAYGHGTHVASIAAGRPVTYNYAPDLTGIAPNADIYDVKVLDANGLGTISDAMEGIQWVIYNAKKYNIRVMNLSLAAASTDSWQTDPLCAAVRSASAAGITVVVAAGNFGLNALGQENYGTISAPGNDPTVITVGSVNFKDTPERSDDIVNRFS